MTSSRFLFLLTAALLAACTQINGLLPGNQSYADAPVTSDAVNEPEIAAEAKPQEQPVPETPLVLATKAEPAPTSAPATEDNAEAIAAKIAVLRNDAEKAAAGYTAHESALKTLSAKNDSEAKDFDKIARVIDSHMKRKPRKNDVFLEKQTKLARTSLENQARQLDEITAIANTVAAEADAAPKMLKAIRSTFALSSASYEDHLALTQMENKVNSLMGDTGSQKSMIAEELTRRADRFNGQRRRLQEINTLISQRNEETAKPVAEAKTQTAFNASKPLVVIQFDAEAVDYKQALSVAISEALKRYPQVSFEVMAVSSTETTQLINGVSLEDSARKVAFDIIAQGVPQSRLRLSKLKTPDVTGPQVQVFLR